MGQVIGYRYYMDLHMGLCRGPVDEVVEIRVGDKKAWPLERIVTTGGGYVDEVITIDGTGDNAGMTFTEIRRVYVPPTYTTIPADPPITDSVDQVSIDAPELFGGDKKEGGVQGKLDVMMGKLDQGVNPRLSNLLGGTLVTAFRGRLTMFFSGLVTSLNPYPKPWKFRLRRYLKGWMDDDPFYPTKALISITETFPDEPGGPAVAHTIKSMNGAHIVYECLTNKEWGRGLPKEMLDIPSFETAADKLHAEGFGLCLLWARQDNVAPFVQSVIDHIGAVLYVDKSTGLVTLKLVRSDYNPLDLPLFSHTNGVLSVDDDDNSNQSEAVNEVIVKFKYPITGQDGQVRAQNLAAIQSYGCVNSKTVEYPGIPTPSLASRVALRDLRVHAADLRRLKIRMNRKAWQLQPGALFRLSSPSNFISNMVLRVSALTEKTNSEIEVTAVQDVFGLRTTSYVSPTTPTPTPAQSPVPALNSRMLEASYFDLVTQLAAADLAALTANDTHAFLVGAQPSSYALGFQVWSGTATGGYRVKGNGNWAGYALTAASMDRLQTTIALSPVNLLTGPAVGDLVYIEDEIVQVQSWNFGTNVLTVLRGCIDTVPVAHPSNAEVWFYTKGFGFDPVKYVEGETVGGKVLTETGNGVLHDSLATLKTKMMVGRQGRPYPPGMVKINTTEYPSGDTFEIGFTVRWTHRNKTTQADTVVPFRHNGVTPPAGLTYRVRVYRASDNALISDNAGIVGTSFVFTEAMWSASSKPANVIVRVSSELGGEESWQSVYMPITIVDDGWNLNWGNDWGGTP